MTVMYLEWVSRHDRGDNIYMIECRSLQMVLESIFNLSVRVCLGS